MKYRLLKEAALRELMEENENTGISMGGLGPNDPITLPKCKMVLCSMAMTTRSPRVREHLEKTINDPIKTRSWIQSLVDNYGCETMRDFIRSVKEEFSSIPWFQKDPESAPHESYVGEARENFWHREAGDSGWLENDWDLPKYIRRTSGKNRDAFGVEEAEGLRSAFRPSERKTILNSKRRIKMLADRLISGTKSTTEVAQTIKSLELAVDNLKRELQYWGEDSGVSVPDSDDVPFGDI